MEQTDIGGSQHPGLFCAALNITNSALLQANASNVFQVKHSIHPQNGLVIELHKFAGKQKIPLRQVASWVQSIFPECFTCSLKTLESRITRVIETEKKFKKKRKCFI